MSSACTTLTIKSLNVTLSFCTPDRVDSKMDVIIDTRSHEWENFEDLKVERSATQELISFPVRPRHEPLVRDDYHELVERFTNDIKTNKYKSFQFVDTVGSASSVIIIWPIYKNFAEISVNDAFDEICEAYRSQNKVINLTTPRYSRQIAFVKWYMSGKDWHNYTAELGKKARAKVRSKYNKQENGDIRVNDMRRILPGAPYIKNCFLDNYSTICVEFGTKNEWIGLVPEYMGPYSIKFTDVTGTEITEVSHHLHHLMYSLYIFDEDLDENGVLKPQWFVDHQGLVGLKAYLSCHPRGLVNRYGVHKEPRYIYWEGKHMPYHQAMTSVFSRLYAEKARETVAYKNLEQWRNKGINLYILSPGGYDFTEDGLTFKEHMKNGNTWGVAQIIYGMLTKQEIWNL